MIERGNGAGFLQHIFMADGAAAVGPPRNLSATSRWTFRHGHDTPRPCHLRRALVQLVVAEFLP